MAKKIGPLEVGDVLQRMAVPMDRHNFHVSKKVPEGTLLATGINVPPEFPESDVEAEINCHWLIHGADPAGPDVSADDDYWVEVKDGEVHIGFHFHLKKGDRLDVIVVDPPSSESSGGG